MIRPAGCLSLAIALLFLSPGPCSAEPVAVGVYPVPVVEMKEQVTDWLQGEGFRIVREVTDDGGVSLECEKARHLVLVQITPRSPTASSVLVSGTAGYGDAGATGAGLKEFLTARALNVDGKKRADSLTLPRGVAVHEGAVFCLRASSHGVPIGFSGFAVDRRGLIISTAHDLDGVRWVAVGTGAGIEARGEVVWRDVLSDLSLIRVRRTFAEVVSLRNGRRSLREGERIFSLPCPAGNRGSARAGVFDDPPAMVNGKPLWQANLPVSPGDSGSPVFDADGRLVGMVKGRFRGTGTRGFLIPLDTIRDFLRKGGR
jgi:serine protease Do